MAKKLRVGDSIRGYRVTKIFGPGMMAIYATEAYWWAARPFWVLIWSGVFERHPGLRIVVVESGGCYWAAEVCRTLDISEVNQRVLLHRARLRVREDLRTIHSPGAT